MHPRDTPRLQLHHIKTRATLRHNDERVVKARLTSPSIRVQIRLYIRGVLEDRGDGGCGVAAGHAARAGDEEVAEFWGGEEYGFSGRVVAGYVPADWGRAAWLGWGPGVLAGLGSHGGDVIVEGYDEGDGK
jgi:hypothetical protein